MRRARPGQESPQQQNLQVSRLVLPAPPRKGAATQVMAEQLDLRRAALPRSQATSTLRQGLQAAEQAGASSPAARWCSKAQPLLQLHPRAVQPQLWPCITGGSLTCHPRACPCAAQGPRGSGRGCFLKRPPQGRPCAPTALLWGPQPQLWHQGLGPLQQRLLCAARGPERQGT